MNLKQLRPSLFILPLGLLLLGGPGLARSLPEFVRDIKVPPLQIDPPRPTVETLASGAKLISAPDDSLPFLTLRFEFEGGTNAEPVAHNGRLEAMAELMEIGGAGSRSGDEVAEALARIGAKLETSADYESWSVSLTVLKADFDTGFGILSDVLLRPRFPEERLAVVKNSFLTGIKQRNDRPADIARRKLTEVLYGDLRSGTAIQVENVKRLTVADLKAEHKRRLSTGKLWIALSGDFAGLNIKERSAKLLEGLPRDSTLKIEDARRSKNPFTKRILLVKRPAAQATIMAGTYLPAHNNPDFYALQTGNYILGGGSFNSRLMREIRTERGLAYYAYSYNRFLKQGGTFYAGSGTRVNAAAETVGLLLKLVGEMPRNLQAAELNLAREAILNSMVFQYASPASLVSSEIRFRRHGMPENYLKVFADKVRALSVRDVEKVFGRRLAPGDLSIVVVGPESLKTELSKLRPVVVVDPEAVDFRDRLK